jgi:hypothetical protein
MIKNIIIGLVLLGLIIWGVVHYNKQASPANTTAETVTGCYISKLNKDVYTLKIDSQNGQDIEGSLNYKNFEKDSSSGSLNGTYKNGIIVGDYTFDSEGMHSIRQVTFKKVPTGFVQGFGPVTVVDNRESFKDLNDISYNTPSIFVASPSCEDTITYTEGAGTYSFNYDSSFVATNGPKKLTSSWNAFPVGKGVVLGTLTIPKDYMPNTNFSEAKLAVSRSSDTNAIKNCEVVPPNSGGETAGQVTIADHPFQKMLFKDAGAGNLYDTTSYRGILDGDCYVIEYTIHSTNISNYPPEQGIQEFDKAKITAEMEKIINSLKFQLASD